MRVGGQEVHPAPFQQIVRHALRMPALVSGQRVRRHLDQHASAQPVAHSLRLLLQRGIALRVGQDRGQAGELQCVEGFGQPRGKAIVRHLNQQVAQPVDAELRRVCLRLLQVFEGEVKVASAAQRQRDVLLGKPLAQIFGLGRIGLAVEGEVIVRVGRARHMRNPLAGRQPRHLDRSLDAVCSVVHSGQKMMMDVYHFNRKGNTV
jgi:hypothetical protein